MALTSSRLSLDAVIQSIYETTLDVSQWGTVLEQVSQAAGAIGGHFFYWDDITKQAGDGHVSFAFDEAQSYVYATHYAHIDPRRAWVMSQGVGEWRACHHRFDQRFVAHDPCYNEFLMPNGIRYTAGAVLSDNDHQSGVIGLFRAPGQDPYDADALDVLQQLKPHLMRASRLGTQLRNLQGQALLGESALDNVDFMIMVTDGDGRLRHANRHGEMALTRDGFPLTVRDGRLRARQTHEQQALEHALTLACGHPRMAHPIALSDGPDRLPVTCVPLTPSHPLASLDTVPLAMLLARAGPAQPAARAQLLAHLFGLGAAETDIGLALSAGLSLDEIAAQRRSSIHTVRSQLRSIMAKTGARRQSELVSLLHRVPGVRVDRPWDE
ncbi:helix-turn-helix transcriptional regulator [Pandoraea terrae]|nr:helix-turn-helix transcriptional regulator [Pandoraea terrae]